MSIWKHLRAITVLPGMGIIVIPAIILYLTVPVKPGWSLLFPLCLASLLPGLCFIALGLLLMIKTISMFVSVGKGTLAPWDATSHLVVRGVYRRVRNPMISGVSCILLGEAALLMSLPLFFWFLVFALGNVIYMPLMEEPGLEERFGEEYLLSFLQKD